MRFNVGRSALGGQPADLQAVKVGQLHPSLALPPGGAREQAMSLTSGPAGTHMFLAPPLDWEVEALAGLCFACTLHFAPGLPDSIFVFQGRGGEQWPIPAPVFATPGKMRAWVEADTNVANFQLMEAGTGIVRCLRTIGLTPGRPGVGEGGPRPHALPGRPGALRRATRQIWPARPLTAGQDVALGRATPCLVPGVTDSLASRSGVQATLDHAP